jgi:hypothetical protein
MLEGKKAGKQSPRVFVRGSNEVVDPAMLPSPRTMRVLLAGCAEAHMDVTPNMLLRHATSPPWAVRVEARSLYLGAADS